MKAPPDRRQNSSSGPITPTRVVDEVARRLRALLTEGDVRPGDRLPSERDLAVQFGVGRPAVREAMRELRSEGLVSVGRGRQGTVVAARIPEPIKAAAPDTPRQSPSGLGANQAPVAPAAEARGPSTLRDLMELRTAIESQTAALAIRRGTQGDIEAIAAALPDQDSLDARDDLRFHDAIAAASHNPAMRQAVNDVVERLHTLASSDLPTLYEQPHRAAIRGQHAAILDGIRHEDEAGAKRAVVRHLDYVVRVLDRLQGTRRHVRMLVCDLDGTLLAGPRLITETTREAVAEARDRGVVVVLASARPPRSMRGYHALLGLNTPVIAGNGALLWHLDSSIPAARESIEHGMARSIVDLGRSVGAIVNVESDDEWFAESTNQRLLRNLQVYGLEPPHRVGPVDDLLDGEEPIDKIFLDLRDMGPEPRRAARASVAVAFGGEVNITETVDGLVDLVSPRATKAVMAQRYARSRGIEADEVAAIGDHDNDVALLRWAGTGIAMGNATVAAKLAADLVTSSNLRDGVAEAIENWVLPE